MPTVIGTKKKVKTVKLGNESMNSIAINPISPQSSAVGFLPHDLFSTLRSSSKRKLNAKKRIRKRAKTQNAKTAATIAASG